MTDAALPVTQSAVEQFTRRYLESFGCSIETEANRWTVEVPEESDIEVSDSEFVLRCTADEAEVDEGEDPLHPESSFFQTIIEEAASQNQIGTTSITADDIEIQLPGWAVESDLEIVDAKFSPYYDRSAVTTLVRISIETVSEYQTELLRAVSFDTRSKERLPELTKKLLKLTGVDSGPIRGGNRTLSREEIRQHLEYGSQETQEIVQPEIEEIHKNASRAADVELEEYRRLQQQRIDELQEDLESLTTRIDELSQQIQRVSEQAERKDLLQERKRLKGERDGLRDQLLEKREQREAGFPEEQRDIRNRHSLEVKIEPVAITIVEYETGELTLSFATDSGNQTVTVGYGSGAGTTESVICDRCEQTLTSDNPLYLADGQTVCHSCKGS